MTVQVRVASDVLDAARSKMDALEILAAPHIVRIDTAEKRLRQAEHDASVAQMRERLDPLSQEPPWRTIKRGAGIEPPGLEL